MFSVIYAKFRWGESLRRLKILKDIISDLETKETKNKIALEINEMAKVL